MQHKFTIFFSRMHFRLNYGQDTTTSTLLNSHFMSRSLRSIQKTMYFSVLCCSCYYYYYCCCCCYYCYYYYCYYHYYYCYYYYWKQNCNYFHQYGFYNVRLHIFYDMYGNIRIVNNTISSNISASFSGWSIIQVTKSRWRSWVGGACGT